MIAAIFFVAVLCAQGCFAEIFRRQVNGIATITTTATTTATITQACTATGLTTSTSTSSTSTSSSSSSMSVSASTPQTSSPYTFIGCYSEVPGRALTDAGNGSAGSVENCASFCSQYQYFGLEYYGECYCGNTLNSASVPTTGCTYTCNLNPNETCGGSGVFDLYSHTPSTGSSTASPTSSFSTTVGSTTSSSTTSTTGPATPSTVLAVGPYVFQGCYNEATANGRALGDAYGNATTSSIDRCEDFCYNTAGGPYTYFGVEYYGECYCGNTLNPSALPGATTCNTPCDLDKTQYCGGASVLDLYKLSSSGNPTSSSSLAPSPSTSLSTPSSMSSTMAATSTSVATSATTTITSCASTVQRCIATHTECIGVATETNCLATVTETKCLATITSTATVTSIVTATISAR